MLVNIGLAPSGERPPLRLIKSERQESRGSVHEVLVNGHASGIPWQRST
ncbi:hypothetical protein AB0B21_38765 [Streptomyces rimosus]|nr:hypothetical protein [Streptomyces rimosus]